MSPTTLAAIAVPIAAIVAGLFGYVGAKFARRKEQADAASIVTATALSLIAPLNADISKLSGRVSTLENENHRLLARVAGLEVDNRNLRGENSGLRARVTSLESQLLALGHTPVNGSPATVTTSTTETKTVIQEEQQ